MSHEPGSTILAYSVHWLALKVLKALLECPLRPLSTRVSTEPTRVSPESTCLMPWLSTVTIRNIPSVRFNCTINDIKALALLDSGAAGYEGYVSYQFCEEYGIKVKKTPKKKQIQQSRESSEDETSSSSRAPKTPRKQKPNTKKQVGKKKHTKSKSSTNTTVNTTGKGKKAGSTTFTPDELLLLSKAYMKVSCNAKHRTNKMAEKFWDDIALHYVEFVGKANSINEDNIDYAIIDILRNAESLQNCW